MYADALVKRAVVLASSGREEECEAEFKKAVEMKKDHADIYLQRGRVRRKSLVVVYGATLLSNLLVPLSSCFWMVRILSSFSDP